MEYILLIIGFLFLVKGADLFVEGSSNLAKTFRIPTLIIGLTVVAFGTSAPEAAVSITASLKGANDISVGNVVGSNICNFLLVLGCSSLFCPLKAKKQIIEQDFLFCLISSLILFFMVYDGFQESGISMISQSEGFILLCFLGIYVYSLILSAMHTEKLKVEKKKFEGKDIIYFIVGLIAILFGGNFVVENAVIIAENFNVSEHVIALTIVAIGTSLPELVTSIVAAKKGESDIAIGNVIGSNIFNIFFILGSSAAISPITLQLDSYYDIIIMMAVGFIVYLFTLKNNRIGYVKGISMLLIYAIYIIYILKR